MTLCDTHPVDMTSMLQGLVQKGYLAKIGQGRGSRYHLPGVPPEGSIDPFGPGLFSLPPDLAGQSPDLASPDPSPGWRIPDLGRPLIASLDQIDEASLSRLSRISDRISGGRVPRDLMVGVIAELCEGRYVTLRVLARLLGRSEDHLRKGYLNPLVRHGDLMLAFPQSPNDPRQAYTAPDTNRQKC